MNPETTQVAMLYQDPHPAHRGFAEAIDADLIDYHRLNIGALEGTMIEDMLNGILYPEYDIYIVEGSRPLYAALTHRLFKHGKLVYLCADHGFYQLGDPQFESSTVIKSLVGKFGSPLVQAVGRRYIDGVVAISDFSKEFVKNIVGPSTPIEIAHPYIQPDVYTALGETQPKLEKNTAVTVSRAWKYKGIDMLVDVWPRVRDVFPEAELHIVGKGHPESYAKTPGVTVRGYVEDLNDVFDSASLFVQPSRMDAFGVSTVEAMRAGIPAVVTNTSGTRSEIQNIDPSLVVNPTSDGLANGVIQYFQRGLTDRSRLAALSREHGNKFDPESRKAAFRKAFYAILKAL